MVDRLQTFSLTERLKATEDLNFTKNSKKETSGGKDVSIIEKTKTKSRHSRKNI